MKINKTSLDGVFTFETTPFIDERGSFSRLFCQGELAEIIGNRQIVQMNQSTNLHVGTVRGLHYQRPPYAEMKLVRCLKGRVFDVAVDIRRDSPTFLRWVGVELSEDNNTTIVIPEGFAHGFQVLEAGSQLLYLHTQYYTKEADVGIHYSLVDWPVAPTNLSEKDKGLEVLS